MHAGGCQTSPQGDIDSIVQKVGAPRKHGLQAGLRNNVEDGRVVDTAGNKVAGGCQP